MYIITGFNKSKLLYVRLNILHSRYTLLSCSSVKFWHIKWWSTKR